jgi:glycosyltransferase involved in cell wall biosynthesis
VSTDVTGIPEILRHDETGLIAREGDPAELADALERLLGDAALRSRFSQAGRAHIEREFDIHRNAAALRGVFAQSLARRAEGFEKGAA